MKLRAKICMDKKGVLNMSHRKEMIQCLIDTWNHEKEDLMEMSDSELEQLINDYNDDSDMFPNGRDEDAEDEDFF